MKKTSVIFLSLAVISAACTSKIQQPQPTDVSDARHFYIDVHNLEPGKVTAADVAGAHQKDLATQDQFGVSFLSYWVDEVKGKVYCLSESPDDSSIYKTHKLAHGLVPDQIEQVTEGTAAAMRSRGNLYLDIHRLGAGKVTAQAVADAHVKDLAVQGKYDVNLINYWVDEKAGIVMCLAEAPDSAAMVHTHQEAHGLIPDEVHLVTQGN